MSNDDRAIAAFRTAYAATIPDAHYCYKTHNYRTRTVTVTIGEIAGVAGWTVLPPVLTDQLTRLVERGEATVIQP